MVANCKQDQYLFLVWESADLAPARGYSKPDSPARAQVDNMDKALWIWVNPWGYSSTGYHCYRTGSLWWIWLKTLFQTLSLDRQFSTVLKRHCQKRSGSRGGGVWAGGRWVKMEMWAGEEDCKTWLPAVCPALLFTPSLWPGKIHIFSQNHLNPESISHTTYFSSAFALLLYCQLTHLDVGFGHKYRKIWLNDWTVSSLPCILNNLPSFDKQSEAAGVEERPFMFPWVRRSRSKIMVEAPCSSNSSSSSSSCNSSSSNI